MVKIAVVDDSSASRKTVVELLESLGFEAVEYFSPIEALSAIQEGEFAAAIFDDVMPGVSGFTACKHVAEGARNAKVRVLPMVMHGEKTQATDHRFALMCGVREWSPKSKGIKSLETALRNIPELFAVMEASGLEKAAGKAKKRVAAISRAL